MPKPKLYGVPISAPTRNVAVLLDVLNVDYEYENCHPLTGDTHTPQFLKINPQHNVPVFVDACGFTMNESRPIAVYVAQKYDKGKTLYPSDIKEQALINNRLAFDSGVLFKAFADAYMPLLLGTSCKVCKDTMVRMKEVFGFLEGFLKGGSGYVAGTEKPSVADFCILVSYEAIKDLFAPKYIDLDEFPESKKWAAKMRGEVPNYEKVNVEGSKGFADFIKEKSGI